MPSRPKGRRRALLRLNHRIHRADLDSNPSAVVAGSTFLPVEVRHSILPGEARHPNLGCKAAVGIHIALAVHTVLAGHHNRHLALAAGKAPSGCTAMVTPGPSSRRDQHRSALAEERQVEGHSVPGNCCCLTWWRAGKWTAGLQQGGQM
jgi:hypothetical protein